MIIPYGFLKQRSSFTPIDLSGLNFTHIWSFFKSNQATIDYCVRVSHIAGTSNYRYLFYDSNGEISLNSQVSTTTTPNESKTLSQRITDIGGSPNMHIIDWYDQIGSVSIAIPSGGTVTNMPKIVNAGALVTKNSTVAIDFFGTGGFLETGSGITELAKGVDCSISAVASSSQLATVSILTTTVDAAAAPNNRFEVAMDTSTAKVMATIKEGGTAHSATYIAQENNTNQKRLVICKDDGTNITAYLDDNLEDTETIGTGTYTNDQFRLGANFSGASDFEGEVQFIGIHDAVLTSGNVTTLDGKLNEHFSF